jgi:predicted phosphoribosyltransferase
MLRFTDRPEAGRLLANQLGEYAGRKEVIVIPVRVRAIAVAESLSAVLRSLYVTAYAEHEALASLAGRTAILVDDGFDSIPRMREAMIVARGCDAVRVVAAAPVGELEVSHAISRMADHSICLSTPVPFHSVGFWYDDSSRAAARAVFVGKPERRIAAIR